MYKFDLDKWIRRKLSITRPGRRSIGRAFARLFFGGSLFLFVFDRKEGNPAMSTYPPPSYTILSYAPPTYLPCPSIRNAGAFTTAILAFHFTPVSLSNDRIFSSVYPYRPVPRPFVSKPLELKRPHNNPLSSLANRYRMPLPVLSICSSSFP